MLFGRHCHGRAQHHRCEARDFEGQQIRLHLLPRDRLRAYRQLTQNHAADLVERARAAPRMVDLLQPLLRIAEIE